MIFIIGIFPGITLKFMGEAKARRQARRKNESRNRRTAI